MAATTADTAPDNTTAGDPASAWMVIQVNACGRARWRLVDRDGNEIGAPASDVADGNQTNPEWAPDGQRLTFGMTGEDGRDDLWVVDADGGNASVLYDCTDDCEYIDDPAWSGEPHTAGSAAVVVPHTVAAVSRVEGGCEGDPGFLLALIDCVRDQTSLSHLLAPIADLESIRAQLQRLGDSAVQIESGTCQGV